MTERGLPHLPNLRDLGGQSGIDGRPVRSGWLWRSDSPSDLDPGEVEVLIGECGIGVALDLRTDADVQRAPAYPLAAAGVRWVRLPIGSQLHSGVPLPDTLDLAVAYRAYLDQDRASVVSALQEIARSTTPVLVHCAAGKDRTGTVVALALALCGVGSEQIVADYVLTDDHMPALLREWERRSPGAEALMDAMPEGLFRAVPHTMTQFLARVQAEHGGAEAWATGAGLTAEDLRALRATLLA